MTEVSFHFNVPDRTGYACRLLRKARRQGVKVAVTGPLAALSALDRALWEFDAVEFIPHVMAAHGATVAPRLRDTPVWLVESPVVSPYHEVLVNLGHDTPEGFESYARVIEIVSVADGERLAARGRWKHYAARGYAIERHEVSS